MSEFPIYEYKSTGAKFKCIFHAMAYGFEWYGFKKIDKNIMEGFVMNNRDTIDEFGTFDVREVLNLCHKNHVILKAQELSKILPPVGFRRIN